MASLVNSSPRFSILIPTYNQPRLLALAIESVLLQTFSDFEILVVADGCTDDTADRVRAFGDPRIRLFDLPKAPGFGYANRNVALKDARGELIAFLAHDDLYAPHHLETMNREFGDPEVHWAYSRPITVESNGAYHPSSFNLNVPGSLESLLKREASIPACTVVYRATCHDRFGFWDGRIERAGDREIWARYINGVGAERIRFVPHPTTLHFRAPWRTNLRSPSLKTRSYAEPYPGDWPLRVEMGDSEIEQEVFLVNMSEDPTCWVFCLERDVQAVLDGKLSIYEQNRRNRTKARIKGWRERNREKPRNPDSAS